MRSTGCRDGRRRHRGTRYRRSMRTRPAAATRPHALPGTGPASPPCPHAADARGPGEGACYSRTSPLIALLRARPGGPCGEISGKRRKLFRWHPLRAHEENGGERPTVLQRAMPVPAACRVISVRFWRIVRVVDAGTPSVTRAHRALHLMAGHGGILHWRSRRACRSSATAAAGEARGEGDPWRLSPAHGWGAQVRPRERRTRPGEPAA